MRSTSEKEKTRMRRVHYFLVVGKRNSQAGEEEVRSEETSLPFRRRVGRERRKEEEIPKGHPKEAIRPQGKKGRASPRKRGRRDWFTKKEAKGLACCLSCFSVSGEGRGELSSN